jgi:hypothetical protein
MNIFNRKERKVMSKERKVSTVYKNFAPFAVYVFLIIKFASLNSFHNYLFI